MLTVPILVCFFFPSFPLTLLPPFVLFSFLVSPPLGEVPEDVIAWIENKNIRAIKAFSNWAKNVEEVETKIFLESPRKELEHVGAFLIQAALPSSSLAPLRAKNAYKTYW